MVPGSSTPAAADFMFEQLLSQQWWSCQLEAAHLVLGKQQQQQCGHRYLRAAVVELPSVQAT